MWKSIGLRANRKGQILGPDKKCDGDKRASDVKRSRLGSCFGSVWVTINLREPEDLRSSVGVSLPGGDQLVKMCIRLEDKKKKKELEICILQVEKETSNLEYEISRNHSRLTVVGQTDIYTTANPYLDYAWNLGKTAIYCIVKYRTSRGGVINCIDTIRNNHPNAIISPQTSRAP